MRLVFFDLETGGVDERYPIIQFAGIAVDQSTLEEIESCEIKLSFDETACDPEALKANAYDPLLWADFAILPERAVEKMYHFFRRHATVPKISQKPPYRVYQVAQPVGHNAAAFDGPRLQSLFKQHSKFLPASYLVLDTLQLALWYFHIHHQVDKPENYKLGTLCDYFGIETPLQHDALEDVRYTIKLYRSLRRGMSLIPLPSV